MARYNGIGRFKGFNFYLVNEQTVSGGSRLVEHQFPYRDEYGIDDLGADINRFEVQMHFLGDDYITQFERFLDALKRDRTGDLVHPFFPRGRYIVESYRGGIEPAKQRLSYFSLTLIKYEDKISPIGALNTLISTLESINNMIDSAIEKFEQYWSVFDDVLYAVDLVESMVDRVQIAVDSLMGGGRVFELTNKLSNIKESATRLVNTPRELANQLTGSILSIGKETTPSDAYMVYGSIRNNLETSREYKTKWSQIIVNGEPFTLASSGYENFNVKSKKNRDMLDLLVECVAFCGQLRAICESLQLEINAIKVKQKPKTPIMGSFVNPIDAKDGDKDVLTMTIIKPPIVTQSDALEIIESTAEQLDQLMLKLSDNDWDYLSVMDARLKFIQDLETKTEKLIGTRRIMTNDTSPALSVLFQHTQDSRDWQEFSARNGIRNPLFVLANESYEVLDD